MFLERPVVGERHPESFEGVQATVHFSVLISSVRTLKFVIISTRYQDAP
jgi:hypothetical protein